MAKPTSPPAAAPDAMRLASSARKIAKRGPAPVHLWNPDFCGDLDMRIARDGTWFYLGTPIGRPALVALFSSILKYEEGRYYLVTPVEKVGITVDDAPFVAVDFHAKGTGAEQSLSFETNVGEFVTASRAHPLRFAFDPQSGEPSPYLLVRDGLEALIDRKSFYRLVDLAVVQPFEGEDYLGVWSDAVFFPLLPADQLQ